MPPPHYLWDQDNVKGDINKCQTKFKKKTYQYFKNFNEENQEGIQIRGNIIFLIRFQN